MDLPDQQIASLLVKRDEAAFEQVFKTHYKNLYAYAFTILKNEDEAEETVQQVFFKFRDALNELPEQCRTVFQLSRFEDMKYKEIADKLDISVKTVENHMGKALKLLRIKLVDYLPFLFILLNL